METKTKSLPTRLETLAFTLLEGSILGLGAIVAPMLFRRITSRDRAGRIFGDLLKIWFWLGLACLLVLTFTGGRTLAARKGFSPWLVARLAIVLAMLGMVGNFRLVLARMDTIRAGLNGPIETYPAESGPRAEFNTLHRASTKQMQTVMGLGLGWLGLTVVARFTSK